MAVVAAYALVDVNAVVEEDVVRQIIGARPPERHARSITLPDRLQHFAVGPHLRMAVHARFGGRHAREAGLFHGCMAITAVKAQAADVMLMAERNRLRVDNATIRVVRRTLHHFEKPEQREGNHHATEKR
jgi:hypothetical protein